MRRKEIYLQKHPETAIGASGVRRAKLPENRKANVEYPAIRFTLEAAKISGKAAWCCRRMP
jgi:hypothetical protein